ncbi:LETM1 domain-containing protein 1-like isoform X2 [Montipora foliosa]|uniref:LETM1 domain-containing protein 1-like isoform X2 n=1 Tax=Montipora foliosa TaxID=591990 RepID=UPI0035F12EE9
MTVALSLCCSRVSASHHHRLHKVAFNHVRVAASSLNRLRENQASHFSTTCSNSTRGDSRIQKLGKVVAAFVGGSKQLGKDVKLMFEIQKKLKNNSYNWDILKTEEIIHLHQTRKDLLKSLPVVVAFFIPFLGYVVPFVAFLYPKQLLSRHYWQPHQKEKFVIQDITRRRRHYLPLVREVGRLALGYKAHSQSEDLMSTSVKVVEKQHPSNQELLNAVEFFKGELLSFDYLPRYHLVCHSRGLDTTDVDPEALVQWLADWVELSNAAGDTDESFMAHCAVFKTMNYKSDKDVHIRQTR